MWNPMCQTGFTPPPFYLGYLRLGRSEQICSLNGRSYFHRRNGVSLSRTSPSSRYLFFVLSQGRINMICVSSWIWDAACFGLIVDKITMVTKHRILSAFQREHNNQRISAPRCKYDQPLQVFGFQHVLVFFYSAIFSFFVFASALRTMCLIN